MGDLIMSAPAIRALKETFSCRITVLTSSMAAGIVPFIPEIDDTIVFDLPWVKAKETVAGDDIFNLVKQLKQRDFDAAVIFTVFSQNPLPAAMIAFMAGIPLRLAYCRENPYALLSNWLPDKEPYTFIRHQVERDLALVSSVGASTKSTNLSLAVDDVTASTVQKKLAIRGIDMSKPWLIFHAGVSEKKRQFPAGEWIKSARSLIDEKRFQILFTGAGSEKEMCDELAEKTGNDAFSVAGLFSLSDFIVLIKQAPVVVTVNTGTVHIAAAVHTPVVVLYAQTNPQHTPWKVPSRILEFEVESESRSKNEVLQYLYRDVYKTPAPMPQSQEIVDAVADLLTETTEEKDLHLDASTVK